MCRKVYPRPILPSSAIQTPSRRLVITGGSFRTIKARAIHTRRAWRLLRQCYHRQWRLHLPDCRARRAPAQLQSPAYQYRDCRPVTRAMLPLPAPFANPPLHTRGHRHLAPVFATPLQPAEMNANANQLMTLHLVPLRRRLALECQVISKRAQLKSRACPVHGIASLQPAATQRRSRRQAGRAQTLRNHPDSRA